MIPHEYALNAVAVVQLPQIFDCAIHFGYLLAQDLRRRQQILFGQLGAKLFGNIGHFVKGRNALMQPLKDLSCTKRLFPHLAQLFLQLRQCPAFNLRFCHMSNLR